MAEFRGKQPLPEICDAGIEELRASVVLCAYRDYMKGCKEIMAIMDTDIEGENLAEMRESFAKKAKRWWNAEAWYANRLIEAKKLRDSAEWFIRGPRFCLFTEALSGDFLMRTMKKQLDDWAKDKDREEEKTGKKRKKKKRG